MLIPINCPICQNPLKNYFNLATLDKECLHHTHLIKIRSKLDKSEIDEILLTYNYQNALVKTVVWWRIIENYTLISTNNGLNLIKIPYFEPDFSSFKKLREKISTYILLS